MISFTGSIETSEKLRAHPNIARHSIRFVAERDSLNAAILGPDITPEQPEFDLFIREVVREMTAKAGQKCTAIRRILVPRAQEAAVIAALKAALAQVKLGDPRSEGKAMGPLVSRAQRDAVRAQIAKLQTEAEIVFGDPDTCAGEGIDAAKGAFISPVLLRATDPMTAKRIHDTEAFGPVATVMAYDDLDQAIELVRRGEGSLVASLFTYDPAVAEAVILGIAPYHGRILIVDRDCARESTGHGSPLPNLVHGGPGRAGGGEELGGLRGVFHYMQRTAVQGSPARLSALTGSWMKGAPAPIAAVHPFKRDYDHLKVGDTIETASRPITLADIEHFAEFTGDNFYAHMDEVGGEGQSVLPGPRRPWLPDPGVCRRAVRRSGAGAAIGQLRPRQSALPQAGVARRCHSGAADGEAEIAGAKTGIRRGALGCRGVQPEQRAGSALRSADHERAGR